MLTYKLHNNGRGYFTDKSYSFIDTDELLTVKIECDEREKSEDMTFTAVLKAGRKNANLIISDGCFIIPEEMRMSGLISVTILLMTGNTTLKIWRCEPINLVSITESIRPLCEITEGISIADEIRMLNNELNEVKERLVLLENNYDPRNI